MSNFFVPFLILLFCYSNMCVALWTNFKKKKAANDCGSRQANNNQQQLQDGSSIVGFEEKKVERISLCYFSLYTAERPIMTRHSVE